jgi:hypothetical protein
MTEQRHRHRGDGQQQQGGEDEAIQIHGSPLNNKQSQMIPVSGTLEKVVGVSTSLLKGNYSPNVSIKAPPMHHGDTEDTEVN